MPDHNPLHTFAPHDLAGMFDISVMTIRRWAEYHAAHLSDGANPTTGQPRRFTWTDVETMRKIKAWRDNGLSVDAINAKLTEANAEANTAVTVAVSAEPVPASQETPSASQLPMVALDDLEKRIDAKLEAMEQRNRPNLWWFAAGLAAGLGMAAVAELFALVAKR